MKIAHFDCFAGISGDMTLGALLDAGVDETRFRAEMAKLSDLGFEIEISKVTKLGIRATDVRVVAGEGHRHRHLNDILAIIEDSRLPENVQARAADVFRRLAEAEAAVHGTTPEEVHFHEVGAVDAIVDVVGAAVGVELLGVERITASALPMGHGFVEAAHGKIPLPAPATVEILKGIPIYSRDVEGETVTPTGAAIIKTFASSFGEMPPMKVEATGYGAGKSDFPYPNVLRVLVGEDSASSEHAAAQVCVVETNIDDMNPELYESVMDKLFGVGALDVYLTPIYMKKNRPATLLSVICPTDRTDDIARAILMETSSFGLRISGAARWCLDRRWETVQTAFGAIRMKLGLLEGSVVTASPEYEDCRKAAESCGVPVKRVYYEALRKYLNSRERQGGQRK